MRSPKRGWRLGGNPHFQHLLIPVVLCTQETVPQIPSGLRALVKEPVFPKGMDAITPCHSSTSPPTVQSLSQVTRSNGDVEDPCSPGLLYSWDLHLCSDGSTLNCFQSSPETSSCNSVLLVRPYSCTCQYPQTYSLKSLRLPRSPPFSPRLVAIHSLLWFPSPSHRTPMSSIQ